MSHKYALITGSSSGIGKATAELFASHGLNLIICGRRQQKLEELQANILQKYPQVKVFILQFDVRFKDEVESALATLPSDVKQNIDILINNAGNAHGLQPIHEGRVEDWEMMLDGNVKGLLYVSRPIIHSMVRREQQRPGQNNFCIVNIGSIAGKETYPNGNVYCASKAAVDVLNKAMRLDLNPFPSIRVAAVHPGLVETEFSNVRFKGDYQKAAQVYKGYTPLTAGDIADIIYFIVSRPQHVNIEDVIVYPTAQASATIKRTSKSKL